MITETKIADKNREHPSSHLYQTLCLIGFFIIWILDSFIFKITIGLSDSIPLIVRISLFLGTLGVAMIFIKLSHDAIFKTSHTEKQGNDDHHHPAELIESGIFTHVRNPMYLGTLIIYVAFILLTLSLSSFIVWIIVFLIFDRMVSFEEKQLELMFGKPYLEYKNRVSKWIPYLKLS